MVKFPLTFVNSLEGLVISLNQMRSMETSLVSKGVSAGVLGGADWVYGARVGAGV